MNELNYPKLRTFIFIVLILFAFISCGGESVKSQKAVSAIKVDGDSNDWDNYGQFLVDELGVIYSVINNDSSLSFLMHFRDPYLARKINNRGFTVWINTEGDNEKVVGIQYSDQKRMERILNDMVDGNEMPRQESEKNKHQLKKMKNVELEGIFTFVNHERTLISQNGENGIHAAVDKNNGRYCFEYQIIPGSQNGLKFTPNTDFKLGIEIAPVSEEFKELVQKRMEDRPNVGMGPRRGMPDGGMHDGKPGAKMGSPPGTVRRNIKNDFDAQEFWFSITLAY